MSWYDHYAVVDGKEVVVNVCGTCNTFKPPRSFHCSACNACIEVHDHHCPWVGTCVGKRNHKYFLAFVSATAVHAVIASVFNGIYLFKNFGKNSENKDQEAGKKMLIVICLAISASFAISLAGMSCFHGMLACRGRTTNEEIRDRYQDGNIYDQGCKTNCN